MIEGIKREKIYGKRVNSQNKKGKYVKSKVSNNSLNDIAIDATIRASALRTSPKSSFKSGISNIYNDTVIVNNNKHNNEIHANINNNGTLKKDLKKDIENNIQNKQITNNSIIIKKEDLREKVRKHGTKLAITLVIDMSGSMISEDKLNKIKSILQKIIANVNINKDKLAVIGFKGKDSEIIIPNTNRPNSFLNKLQNIKVGGTTPMASGLEKGLKILKKEIKKEDYIPMLMILSDGVTNVGLDKSTNRTPNINSFTNFNGNRRNNSNDINNNGCSNSYDHSTSKSKPKSSKKLISTPINDVLTIGNEIAKYDIHTVIVNFEKEKNKGRSVNKELAFVTKGKFYELEKLGDILTNNVFEDESTNKDSISFGSFKSDVSDMVIDKILDYERDNV